MRKDHDAAGLRARARAGGQVSLTDDHAVGYSTVPKKQLDRWDIGTLRSRIRFKMYSGR